MPGELLKKLSNTLSSNQDERDVLNISILGHLGVIVVDGVERSFIFEAEHKYHRVHPGGKLNENGVRIYQRELICNPLVALEALLHLV